MTPGERTRGEGVILALGEVLVEIMRERPGVPLGAVGSVFRGPYASGAPAIFAGAAARLGARVRFVGVRGDDAFGDTCASHLAARGVDVRFLRCDPERATGAAFVAYQDDGDRSFIFHARDAACGGLDVSDVSDAVLDEVVWLHVTGSSLGVSTSVRAAVEAAVARARDRGARIAFDPNLRLELARLDETRALCQHVLPHAYVVLPSGAEAVLLTGLDDPLAACRALLAMGPEVVVWKRGAAGCTVVTAEEAVDVPAYPVDVVDPTGAGDTFAAAFTVASLAGQPPVEAARFASVAAALSTLALGPMEALPSRDDVHARLRGASAS